MTATTVTVQFHSQPVTAIEKDGTHYVALRQIVENIGLDWAAQYTRIKRHPVMSKGVVVMTTPSNGGEQKTFCLPLDMLNGWLFGVEVNRVRPELRERLIQYQLECFGVLNAHFNKRQQPAQPTLPAIKSKTGFVTPDQRNTLSRLIFKGCSLHFSGRLADSHRAQCNLLVDAKFNSKDLRVKEHEFEAAKQFIAEYFAEEGLMAQAPKPQAIGGTVPARVLDNAARIAGQLFGEALKQSALNGNPIDRFLVSADYKSGKCDMELIERDAFVLPMSQLPQAIRTEASIPEALAIMNACAHRLNQHHQQPSLIA